MTEQEATAAVLAAGRKWGYGNMIAHLKRDWIAFLMRYGSTEKQATLAADVSAYPQLTGAVAPPPLESNTELTDAKRSVE